MLDKLPADWKLLPLEDCMSAIIDYRGMTPQKSSFGVPLITAKIVKGGRLLDVDEYIPQEDYDDWMRRGLPEPGDVVMTTEAPLGEIAQLDDRQVALAQRLITLRGKPELLDNTFLKFLMLSDFVQNQLRARATGTTVLGIKQSELRKVILAIPPLREQRAIACILGTLDDEIELNWRMNKTLEAMARALFKSWFVDFEPVYAKAEGKQLVGIDAGTDTLFPSEFEDSPLGKIPREWRVIKVSDFCSTQYGYTASARDKPIGPKFLRITDMNKEDWIDWQSVPYCEITDDTLPKYQLHVGDLLVSRMADPGKAAIVEEDTHAVFASYLVRLTTNNLGSSYYLFYFLRSEQYREYANGAMSGSVQAGMNARVITAANMLLPPQDTIYAFYQRIYPLRQRIVINLKESHTLTDIRAALLSKLMNGEIQIDKAEQFLEIGI